MSSSSSREFREFKEISGISFGILSSEEIKSQSVVEITSYKIALDDPVHNRNGLYDPRLGSVKSGTYCETCGRDGSECTGHFGHITLHRPVIHPLFINHVMILLKFFCVKCYTLLPRIPEKLKFKQRFLSMCDSVKKQPVQECRACGSIQPEYRVSTSDNCTVIQSDGAVLSADTCLRRFENVDDDTVRLIGLDPVLVHPRNFIITAFPIIPTCCRPFVTSDGSTCDDDLTYQLGEIVKNNILFSQTNDERFYWNLLFRIHTYFNNSQKKAKHATTGRAIRGLKDRIAGKTGILRNNLLGKRVNQSGRTVAGPDTFIDIDTAIVPKAMADILTVVEHVNPINIVQMNLLLKNGGINYVIRNGKKINTNIVASGSEGIFRHGDVIRGADFTVKCVVTDTRNVPKLCDGDAVIRDGRQIQQLQKSENLTLEVGDCVYRKLRDGDMVLLNRQPTLHKASMMAFRAKILPINTIKINLAVSSPFNCDFDGDEMNIHVPQNYEAVSELAHLSTVEQCMINTQAGKPNIAIVQDALTAAYLLSKFGNVPLSRSQFFRIISRIEITTRRRREAISIRKNYTRIDVVNFVLPERLNVCRDDLEIRNGRLVRGYLCKKYLGSAHSSLLKTIHALEGAAELSRFVNELQIVCNEWLSTYGFTVHALDCVRKERINDIIDKCFMEAESHKLTIKHPKIRERKIISSLSNAKDIGMRLAKEALDPKNNFITTVESGSKGDWFNLAQIMGLVGQQTVVNGARIRGSDGGRSLPHYPRTGNVPVKQHYESMGFVSSSFEEGLNPCEFFFHAMSGRKGVCDTAMSTATSGYSMRRVVKLTENFTICYDGTVRDNFGRLYQMAYGGLGYDPTRIYENSVCNIRHELDKIHKQTECL